jgi:hypothetical protein
MGTKYKINPDTGVIIFPDGFRLGVPYEHPRYFEYAKWVQEGGKPDHVDVDVVGVVGGLLGD